MPVTDITTDSESLTMTLVADFAAPADRLWGAFTAPRQLERFWGPPGWPSTFSQFDFVVGGKAQYHMTSPKGERSNGGWEFVNITPETSFEVLDSFLDENGQPLEGFPAMRMQFTFESTADGSRMTNTSYFDSAEALAQVVQMGAIEGSRLAMNQLDTVLQDLRDYAQGKGTVTELLDDTHVRITRLIEGQRDLVWRAHHEPELLRQWMLGPEGWQLLEVEVGDSYRYVWQQGDDASTRFGFEGETLLSQSPWRAVTTERMIGMEGEGTINDLQLYEEDGATLVTLLIEYADKEQRDMILATGMTDGMEASYLRLEQVVAAS